MADLEWEGDPDRPSLRRAIRHRLRRVAPGLRVVAEDFLAQTTAIDLLAVGREGELVSVRIARAGREAETLTRILSDLRWLQSHAADFRKLAPEMGLEVSAEPRGLVFAPEIDEETRSAAAFLPESVVTVVGYRCLGRAGRLEVLFEPGWSPDPISNPTPSPSQGATRRAPAGSGGRRGAGPTAEQAGLLSGFSAPESPAPAAAREPLTAPTSASYFRTGLTDEDLRLDEDSK